MKTLPLLLVIGFVALTWAAPAQDTNAVKTVLGTFETQTDIVLIKAVGPVGEMTIGDEVISVRCKETTDASTGHKVYGLALEIAESPQARERLLLDADELDALLNGISYLSKVNNSVTALPGFEATFTSKAGLRLIAESIRREGTVLTFLKYGDHPRIPLGSLQLSQFYNLIDQGQKIIISLQTGK